MLVGAIITDYERAVLDALRESEFLRKSLAINISDVGGVPKTAEALESTKEYLLQEAEFHNVAPEAARRDIQKAERENADLMRLYKARGYKEPCAYGKGRVKVIMRAIEGGRKE